MNIRNLQYVEAIVRHRSFTKAAEELYVTQPALSQMIKGLEAELNIKIFIKKGGKLVPTEAGFALYKHANIILNNLEAAYREMEDVKNVGSSKFKIGIAESTKYWFSKLIILFNYKYPQVNIKIKDLVHGDEIKKSLKNNDIHFTITSDEIEDDELESIPLYEEELVLVTPRNYFPEKLDFIAVSELKNENFIHHKPGNQTGEDLIEACKKSGFIPKGIYEIDQLETAYSLVSAGLGITFIPKKYLEFQSSESVEIIKLINPTPTRTVYLIYNPTRYFPKSFYYFKDLIISHFKNLT